ncbi:CPBP family intramembrane glutamic endopeptidase [Seonamhaeicola marinus]|uniref:CPBP family intramembrane metalloprotease n=1 Tax=Seonamhaeicola marinus TaxID=1912246 RepID=A0A5D0I5P1_9FLAO|nr:CPBP family intramembrane glutamic endopeptidase [Seonamhaeicola marinus]TYA78698.1 CPBP family intramembrane metalloprotease [Seonamhaeicola marinus]
MYIEQAFKGELGFWKYFIIPGLFLSLMGLNFLAIIVLDIDVESVIQTEIENKGENRFLIETLVPFAIGLILLFLWVKFIHKQSLTSLTTSRKKVDWKRVFFSFFFWGIISSGMVLLDYSSNPEDYLFNFKLEPFLYLAAIAIILIPFQTSFEEYLFRGYLMQGIGAFFKNRWLPLILTSVIFGVMHIANPEVEKLGYVLLVYYIGTGLFLGIITLMDDGMELALGFHAANNLFTVLLVTANWTAFQTPSILKSIADPSESTVFEIIVPVFVIFPILIFIFAKVYKWKNWKEKLFGKVKPPKNEDYQVIDEIGTT